MEVHHAIGFPTGQFRQGLTRPTVASLAATFGRGARPTAGSTSRMPTHPRHGRQSRREPSCGFMGHRSEEGRNAKLVVVDRAHATRRSLTSTLPSGGSDIAFSTLDAPRAEHGPFPTRSTSLTPNAPFIVSENTVHRRLFSGFDESKGEYDNRRGLTSPIRRPTGYEVDHTLQHPAASSSCSRKHVDRYTPEMVERILRHAQTSFKVADIVTSRERARPETSCTARVDAALGGRPDDPRGGHAELSWATWAAGRRRECRCAAIRTSRGDGQWPAPSRSCPATLATPRESHRLEDVSGEGERPRWNKQAWSSITTVELPKFMVSLLKATYGKGATKENDWLRVGCRRPTALFLDVYLRRHVSGQLAARGGTEPRPRPSSLSA